MPLISALTSFFRSPPEEAGQGETKQEEEAPHADPAARSQGTGTAVARPMLPQRLYQPGSQGIHLRTLSRVFTQLPKALPNLADVHIDVLEWLMHVALLQTDLVKLHQHLTDITEALNSVEDKFGYGRLHSRIELTAFYADVCGKKTESHPIGPGMPQTVSPIPTLEMGSWSMFASEFDQLRLKLLRKDANTLVPVQIMARRSSLSGSATTNNTAASAFEEDDDETRPTHPLPPQQSPETDTVLEQHVMMQADYHEVAQLFAVQVAFATLQTALDTIQQDRPRNATLLVDKALQSYHTKLKSTFGGRAAQIPPQLRMRSNKMDQISQAIQSVCLNDDDEYSHAQLQQKTRTLLIKWSESILEIPTLFTLGYGGVTAPIVEKNDDDDDVSSFGQAEDAPLETQAPEPLPLHRSKLTKASTKEGFGTTPEERDVLEQLSRGGASPPRSGVAHGRSQVEELEMTPSYYAKARRNDDSEADFPATQDADSSDDLAPPPKPVPDGSKHSGNKDQKPAARKKKPPPSPETSEDEQPVATRKSTSTKKDDSKPAAKRKLVDEPDDLWSDSDESISAKAKKPRKTKEYWDADEEDAVREGVKKFGLGRWAKIKEWAGNRLARRDTVAIKDKHRNMAKKSV